MNYLDTSIEGPLMDSIRENDEEVGQKIQDLMFVFDDLIDVDDRSIQTLLREVQPEMLQKALKGCDDALKEKFFKNMSKRSAEMFKEDLQAMGPVRVSDVEAAQKDILSAARKLADAGQIMLGNAGGESFV